MKRKLRGEKSFSWLAVVRIKGYPTSRVAKALEEVVQAHGVPESIKVDNGPEFISKEVDLWTYLRRVKLDFSRPGKPTDNAFIESFNGRFKQECLNQHWFLSLEDSISKIEAWRKDYNQVHPHSSLEGKTPEEFLAALIRSSSRLKKQIFRIQNGAKMGASSTAGKGSDCARKGLTAINTSVTH